MRGFLAIILLVVVVFAGQPLFVEADVIDQQVTFFVDPSYDLPKRNELAATLRKVTPQMYFYVEDSWWNGLNSQQANALLVSLAQLGTTFERDVYPLVTGFFGQENTPGVDRDSHITVLVHEMREDVRGYVRTADAYTRAESQRSNEREMIYLAASRVTSSLASSYLAHEFTHLVYLNQKELLRGVEDDVWIQEGFAEISPLLAGGTEVSKEYLARRIRDFVTNPRDPVAEWRNSPVDYGVVAMFFEYVREQYGMQLFKDMLSSQKKGIAAFNEALAKAGTQKRFVDVFQGWLYALFLNDCSYGQEFCFQEETVRQLRVAPYTSFLPAFGTSELSFSSQTKEWAGNWYKISGGTKGKLEILFSGNPQAPFRVPYLLEKNTGAYERGTLEINSVTQKGTLVVPQFGGDVSAIILMPFIEGRSSGFGSFDPVYLFSWKIAITQSSSQNPGTIEDLTLQIESLLRQVANLRSQLAALQSQQGAPVSCGLFQSNLFLGLSNSNDVRCLQQQLKDEGPAIYPEGLVTGTFGQLTLGAVIRFQEKYAAEILTPLGLTKGTGYVGSSTRAKLNQLSAP